jgi:hypothetical protein
MRLALNFAKNHYSRKFAVANVCVAASNYCAK